MHVIARMNIGGPAALVADLMRSAVSGKFEQISHGTLRLKNITVSDIKNISFG